MKKIILPLVIAVTSLSVHVNAQVGVNTQTPASTLDVQAKTTGTSAVVEGLLIPRVDRQKAQSMTGVPVSTMIYINSTATGAQTGTAVNIDAEGYYYFNGTAWTKLAGNATPANNIYTNDGTLAGNRIVTQADKTLSFTTDNTKVNAFSVDGSTVSVDALNDRLGVGTTDPQRKLHVNGALQVTNELNVGGTATTAGSAGTTGQILTSSGTGAAPTWTTPAVTVDTNTNIYNTDGTILTNRIVTQADKTLSFTTDNTKVNAFSVDSGTLSVDALNNRVGIGNTTPNSKFFVRGSNSQPVAGTLNPDALVRIDGGTGHHLDIGTLNDNPWGSYINSLSYGGETGMNLSLNSVGGNVGIGTLVPQKTMHVNGSLQVTNEVNVGGSGNTAGSAGTTGQVLTSAGAGAAPTWTTPAVTVDTNTNIYNTDGTILTNRIVTQADKTLSFTTDNTKVNAFSVDGTTLSVDAANNRIGIGTAAPDRPLSVVGGNDATPNSGIVSFMPTNLTQGVAIGWNGIQKIGSMANSDLNLNAAGTGNVALITQGTGNVTVGTRVGIGMTTPNAPLQFANTTANRKVVLYGSNNDHQYYGFGVNGFTLRYQTESTSADHVFFAAASSTDSNELFRIRGNGNATLAGSLTQNSDIRLKKDIVDNTYGLSEISKLRTINYRFKDEQRGTDKKIGFIAQEVKAAMPELVSTANDEMKTLSVSYPEMTVVLTKAVQELQELVKSQQKQIDELKAQIKSKP